MTRVLHVLEALEGGTARHVVDLVRHATASEHHVAVPARRAVGVTDERAAGQVRAAGGTVHVVDMRRSPVSPVNAAALARLAGLARRVGADVLHGHSAVGGALARAVPSAAPRAYTPNGLHPGRAAGAVERLLARRTDAFIAVSPSEGEQARRRRWAREVTVVPNGVDLAAPPALDLHALLGLPAATPLVGTVARLAPQKDPRLVVETAARVLAGHRDAVFVLVGDGELAGETDARAAPLGGRFRRVPVLPGAAAALGSLSAFCLLSRFEGGPYAPLEAARAGIPLVLTDVVGNRDVVEPDRSGLLVRRDPREAAAALLRVLDDRGLADRLVRAMRLRLAERFDVRAQGAAHDALYERLALRSR